MNEVLLIPLTSGGWCVLRDDGSVGVYSANGEWVGGWTAEEDEALRHGPRLAPLPPETLRIVARRRIEENWDG